MNKSFNVSPVLICLLTLLFAIFSIIPNIKAQTPAPGGVSANLVTWLDAEVGASVSNWEDQSVSGNNFVQNNVSNQPELVNLAINGHPAFRFDKTDVDFMTSTRSGILGNNHNYTKFIVYREFTKHSSNPILMMTPSANGHDVFLINSEPTIFHENQNLFKAGHIFPKVNTPHLLSVRYAEGIAAGMNPPNMNIIAIEGKEEDHSFTTQDYFDSILLLGNYGPPRNETFDGYIAEVIMYNRALSFLEMEQVHSYLAIKYGISLNQSTSQNYFDSKGNAVWAGVKGYDNKIIGIGIDSDGNLNQNTSESIDDKVSPSIKITNEAAFTASDDGTYLFISDNAKNGNSPTNYPSSLGGALKTIWVVKKTGAGATTVTITIDLKNTVYSGLTDPNDLFLIQDTDADFSAGASTTLAASIANDKVTFKGIDLQDGQYIGLGEKPKILIAITYLSPAEEKNVKSSTTVPVSYLVELQDNRGVRTSAPRDVQINLEIDESKSTAVEGDFNGISFMNSFTVKFNQGDEQFILELDVIDDRIAEGPESVTVKVSDTQPTLFTKSRSKNSDTGYIVDDEKVVEVRIEPVSQGNETGTVPLVYKVYLYDVSDKMAFENKGKPIRVNVQYSNSSTAMGGTQGTSGIDFESDLKQVIIDTGKSEATFSVPVINDRVVEGPESVILKLTGRSTGGIGIATDPSKASAINNIIDNNLKLEIRFKKKADGAEDETGTPTPATFEMTLYDVRTGNQFVNNGGPITVTYSFIGGNAKGEAAAGTGIDYDNSTTTATIDSGKSTGEISVPVFEDDVKEGTEDIIVRLTAADSGISVPFFSSPNGTKYADIIDDDQLLNVIITASTDGAENNSGMTSPVTFDVTLVEDGTTTAFTNNGADITVMVNLTGVAEGATTANTVLNAGDTDYYNLFTTVTIPNGASTGKLSLPVFEDTKGEGPESVIATLASADRGVGLGDPTDITKTANIADDETKLKIQIFDNTDGDEAIDPSTNLPIPITYSVRIVNEDGSPYTGPKNWGPINFEFGFLNSVAKGTSAPEKANPGNVGNNDYDSATPPQGFAAGATTATISIPVWDDTAEEGSESVEIQLTRVDASLTILQPVAGKQISKIKDNDIIIEAKLSEAVTNGNEAGEIPSTFTVKLSKRSDGSAYSNQSGVPISVTYTLTDNGATGAATANPVRTIGNTDYKNDVLTVDIPAGMSEVEISIPTFDDDAKEGPESFDLTITSVTDGVTVPTGTETRSATIIDNDIDLELRLTASTPGAEVGPVASTFEATLWDTDTDIAFVNPGAALEFDIAYSGNATVAAKGGASDYDNSKTTFNIPKAASKGTISVPTFDDNDEEGPETLTVTLASATVGVGISTDPLYVAQSTIIADDDLELELIFDTSASTVGNEQGTVGATAKVVLVKQGTTTPFINNGLPIEVMYSFEPDNGVAGIARGGSDYDNSGNKITIATGESEKTITVPILDDAVKNEGDETFIVKLDNRTTDILVGAPNQVTLTITDNDVQAIDEPDLDPNPYVVNPTITDPADPDKNTIRGTATIGTIVKVTLDGTDYEVMATADPNDPNKGVFKVDIPPTITAGTYDVAVESRLETTDGRVLVKNPTIGSKVFDDALVIDLTAPDANKTPKAINIIDLNPLSNNGISPNGDGINDFWYIYGIERHKNNSVGVFNRWGKEVWSMNGYNNEDKVFRGERNKGLGKTKVPVGTYFYSIDLGDGSKTKKGYIVIYY